MIITQPTPTEHSHILNMQLSREEICKVLAQESSVSQMMNYIALKELAAYEAREARVFSTLFMVTESSSGVTRDVIYQVEVEVTAKR